jgi:hypothetical protein
MSTTRVRLYGKRLRRLRSRLRRRPPVIHFGVGWYSPVVPKPNLDCVA